MTTRCFICKEPGPVQKLFNKCRHENACYNCLRKRYVEEPKCIYDYPLTCFHPDCQCPPLRGSQVHRFCETENEKYLFLHFSSMVKEFGEKFGDDWTKSKEVFEFFASMGWAVCRCPSCLMLITKTDGCNHMTCFCGREFDWELACMPLYTATFRNKKEITEKLPAPPTKKKKKPPTLQFDNQFDDDSVYDDLYDEDVNDVDSLTDVPTESYPYNATTMISAGDVDNDKESTSATEIIASVKVDSIHNMMSSAKMTDTTIEDFEIVSIESKQSTHDAQSDSTWEELSEISSVISFESRANMSFLEAAKANSGSWQKPVLEQKKRRKVRSKMEGKQEESDEPELELESIGSLDLGSLDWSFDVIVEEEEEDHCRGLIQDPLFEYDGMKCARGGKQKYFFNRQPKLKSRRYKRPSKR